jgi:hypothetical protein
VEGVVFSIDEDGSVDDMFPVGKGKGKREYGT